MAGRKLWLTMKSRKLRFSVRDPCVSAWPRRAGRCWSDYDVENADNDIRRQNKEIQKNGL